MVSSTYSNDRGAIYIFDPSKRCEPSAFLFTRTVKFFLLNGYRLASDIDHCDTILVNTCCVTADKLAVSQAALDAAVENGRGKRIVLLGCMAALSVQGPEREGVIRIGPKNLGELDDHFPHDVSVSRIPVNRLSPDLYTPGQGLDYGDFFVLIAQGCSNHCSYCNIKRAKGDVKSEPVETILSQIQAGFSQGVREFALLADDCASYGHDLETDLATLIERLFAAAPDFRLKLGYLYPGYVLKRFDRLKTIFATGRIAYVNIPVQSGSQRLLNLMNRRYPVDAVLEAVRQLRRIAPRTAFCTHFMMNFPTESPEEFAQSLAAADGFDEVLFLHYSDNPGTDAAGLFPKVPDEEARRRLDRASDYANRCKRGKSAVIKDFNCDIPYNMLGPLER